MIFQNRKQAAEMLIGKLSQFKDKDPLVLGVPRGAIPMAALIADGLDGELGVVLVHKVPAPDSSELAIGSVGISGRMHKMRDAFKFLRIPPHYFEQAAARELEQLRERQRALGIGIPDCRGRTVILVDDGIATGATVEAAIHEIRGDKPDRLIVATAVIARRSFEMLRPLVDELVVLDQPEIFYGVGEFYRDFTQVSDEEARRILISAARARTASRKGESFEAEKPGLE